MIFYFTATGNSLHAANRLAESEETAAVSIPEATAKGEMVYRLAEDEALGFVFPVYAWDVPQIVTDFIGRLTVENYKTQHVFAVFTCGSNSGLTYEKLKETLKRAGIHLDAAYDLTMPDNYIVLFQAPTKEKVEKMLAHADDRLQQIARSVHERRSELSMEGKNPPAFAARCLSCFFRTFSLSTRKFYSTEKCTRCGVCETMCPVSAIQVAEKGPAWIKGQCAKCMACINRCPVHAIEYGKGTRTKGRYVHPDCA